MKIIEEEFFNKLVDKLEELFEKGEKCNCRKRLPGRGRVLSFNAFANIFLKEALASQKSEIKKRLGWSWDKRIDEEGRDSIWDLGDALKVVDDL